MSPWAKRTASLVDAAVALTKDAKSRRRYAQLAGITLEAGREALWTTTFKVTEARLKKTAHPLDAPGAYFCGTLAKLLAEAGVYVPVGTGEERERIRAQIAASFGQSAPP